MRIGFGVDVHRLEENRPLFIGGIEIPSEKGAVGHSDATLPGWLEGGASLTT